MTAITSTYIVTSAPFQGTRFTPSDGYEVDLWEERDPAEKTAMIAHAKVQDTIASVCTIAAIGLGIGISMTASSPVILAMLGIGLTGFLLIGASALAARVTEDITRREGERDKAIKMIFGIVLLPTRSTVTYSSCGFVKKETFEKTTNSSTTEMLTI